MKIEKKKFHDLPYEEVDKLYVRMDKIDFDLMTRYFEAMEKRIEASSNLLEALKEQIEVLTEQNVVLKTMLVMEKPKEEDSKIYCPTDDISCPYCSQGYCTMENPWDECDDYYGIVEDEE